MDAAAVNLGLLRVNQFVLAEQNHVYLGVVLGVTDRVALHTCGVSTILQNHTSSGLSTNTNRVLLDTAKLKSMRKHLASTVVSKADDKRQQLNTYKRKSRSVRCA